MSKNKKTLFTILIIIVIIAIGLIAYQYSGDKLGTKIQENAETEVDKTKKDTVKDSANLKETTQDNKEVTDIINEAVKTQNISLCDTIEDESPEVKIACKFKAITKTAVTKDDLTVCNQIEDEVIKIDCEDAILVNRAIEANNPTLCEKLTNKDKIEFCKIQTTSGGEEQND